MGEDVQNHEDVKAHQGGQVLQEGDELQQLAVATIVVPAFDGNTVLKVVAKGLGRVVNNNSSAQVAPEDGQILDEVSVHRKTMFPEQAIPVEKGKTEKTQFFHVLWTFLQNSEDDALRRTSKYTSKTCTMITNKEIFKILAIYEKP
jgi:hypothetical protein